MTERQMQFRVGVLVLIAGIVAAVLIFQFGEMRWLWQKHYTLELHFEKAPGVERGTPVRKNGVLIGSVRQVTFDNSRGGVNVSVEIVERHSLRKDSGPMLTRSLLGDATIEFSPGKSRELVRNGDRLEGSSSEDPMELVSRIESKMNETLESFAATSDEWRKVGSNVNGLMDTHRGQLDHVIEQAAESLHEFTIAMKSANQTLADPQNQENLRTTLAALPQMMEETRQTNAAIRTSVVKADASLSNLAEVTAPLAKKSQSIVTKLDRSVGNLELLLAEMNQFAGTLNRDEGTLKLLVSDPQLYRNLNESAATLQTIMKQLEPTIRDLRVFADKAARHPELLGAGGALKGSSGLK
ncbi:MAG TPA: MlaD family protein [Planctomycetaceae bacterium]|nr:MlaD family protein [Planctomycetaceae bacterium]